VASTPNDELIQTATAAEIIGISREGVRWLVRNGRLRAAIVLATGIRLFSRAAVEKFAKERRRRIADEVLERAEQRERATA
jgi:excisionase family DNA binding protein